MLSLIAIPLDDIVYIRKPRKPIDHPDFIAHLANKSLFDARKLAIKTAEKARKDAEKVVKDLEQGGPPVPGVVTAIEARLVESRVRETLYQCCIAYYEGNYARLSEVRWLKLLTSKLLSEDKMILR